jgi:hypothetical protein
MQAALKEFTEVMLTDAPSDPVSTRQNIVIDGAEA